MTTYTEAAAYLGAKTDRPLPGRHTRLIRRGPEAIAVRYHGTDVVTYDGAEIILQSGGYQTATTKERINGYSPVRIYQERGIWYVVESGANGYPDHAARSLFYDGIRVKIGPRSGLAYISSGRRSPKETEGIKRQIDRAVSKYIAGFCKHIAELKTLPEPGTGDCWGCLMRPVDDPKVEAMGYSHYLSHFGGTEDEPEPYYVPSMIRNAILTRGYGNPGFIWAMLQGEAARGDARMLGDVLRAHFRKIKPALVAEYKRRAA